jgi:hypothetical protein
LRDAVLDRRGPVGAVGLVEDGDAQRFAGSIDITISGSAVERDRPATD